ncbi:hypothetical protein EDD11_007272 [Mortierella claussenii]|nr:hypothetical protein EDD11_007272 [Mortierella claussenii]
MFKYLDPNLGVPLPGKSYGEVCELNKENTIVRDKGGELGIYAGMKICGYFEMKQNSWQRIAEIPAFKGKMKRTMQQFTLKSWTKFEWESTKSFKSDATVIFVLTMFLICELNVFYLKSLQWLPPAHPINITRIFSYFMFGIPGVREAYQYLHDVIGTECLVMWKFGQEEFVDPAPKVVARFWMAFLALLIVYPIHQSYWLPKQTAAEDHDIEK